MLGCSVISTNVGGISSLITDNETGFLVPANDPYQAAYLINQLYLDIGLNIRIGDNASKIASQRHHKEKITHSLMEIYKQIINESI